MDCLRLKGVFIVVGNGIININWRGYEIEGKYDIYVGLCGRGLFKMSNKGMEIKIDKEMSGISRSDGFYNGECVCVLFINLLDSNATLYDNTDCRNVRVFTPISYISEERYFHWTFQDSLGRTAVKLTF